LPGLLSATGDNQRHSGQIRNTLVRLVIGNASETLREELELFLMDRVGLKLLCDKL
jgi:hypothetical protein